MTISAYFATPIAEFRMDDPQPLCAALTALFLEREKDPEHYRNSTRRSTQHGLFESRFDLFEWRDAPVQQVAAFCHGHTYQVVTAVSKYSDDEARRLRFDYQAWFHVTRDGGFQGLHSHENASWSGIFCVDPGELDAERSANGAVRFHDPRTHAFSYLDAGNMHLKVPFNHGAIQKLHEPGKLLIFPSHLKHEIFPYFGARPRIVIAFNCWLRQLPAVAPDAS